jgi:hypothetical protein
VGIVVFVVAAGSAATRDAPIKGRRPKEKCMMVRENRNGNGKANVDNEVKNEESGHSEGLIFG